MIANTATVTAVTIARNERNHGIYEVHKAGCAHLNLRHMDVMYDGTVTGADVAAYAAAQADDNEGCLYQVGPCLQRGKRPVYGDI